jgi:aspartyl-tRNA(Asn)/glutamyl-tRNA(Gln) amidotransferase subunit C
VTTSFSDDDIRKLARLARLSLADDELAHIKRELSSVVSYVETLATCDVDGVEPMSHAVPTDLRMREDACVDVVGTRALEASQGFTGALVKVPRIIE